MTTIPDGKPINLSQLEQELEGAGVATGGALGMHQPGADEPPGPTTVFLYDAGQPTDFSSGDQPTVQQTIANHVALRPKTDAEYSEEFQATGTTAVRRQEIRDITAGLLPREQVRVDNGLPLEDPASRSSPEPSTAHAQIAAAADLEQLKTALLEAIP